MNCGKAEKLLVEYLYQELSPKRTVDLEKHLHQCSNCAKTLDNWRAIHRGFQGTSDEPQPSPYLKQRILVAAKEELHRLPTFADRLWAFSKVAAAPMMIFIVALLLYLPWQQENSAEKKKMAQVKTEKPVKAAPAPAVARMRVAKKPEAKEDFFERGKREQRKLTAAPPSFLDQKKNEDADFMKKQKEYRPQEVAKDELDAPSDAGATARSESPSDAPAAPVPAPPQTPAVSKEEAPRDSNRESQYMNKVEREEQPQRQALSVTSADDGSYERSQVLFARNDLKNGWNYAQQAIAQDRSKELAGQFHQSGMQFQQRREYDKAIIQYQLVANHYPDYNGKEDVLVRLAESYVEIGQFENARRIYQQLLRVPSQQRLAADKLKELQRKEDAQEQLRSLGYVDPQNK